MIDIEKLAREAGLIEPRDVWVDLPRDYRNALSSLASGALQEVAKVAATLGVPGISNVDDDVVAEWLRTLSRQLSEGG